MAELVREQARRRDEQQNEAAFGRIIEGLGVSHEAKACGQRLLGQRNRRRDPGETLSTSPRVTQ